MTRFNPLRFSASALALAAVATFSVGCDSGTTEPGKTPPGHTDEHGHGEHAIGTVTVEGRSVTVQITGELEASKTYPHCHLVVNGDPVDSMRIWIGDEHGENAVRGAVQGLGSHPIVDLETPADLEGAFLGVEIVVEVTDRDPLGEALVHKGRGLRLRRLPAVHRQRQRRLRAGHGLAGRCRVAGCCRTGGRGGFRVCVVRTGKSTTR